MKHNAHHFLMMDATFLVIRIVKVIWRKMILVISQNPGGRHLARIIKEILKKVNPENQNQDQDQSRNPGERLLLEMQR